MAADPRLPLPGLAGFQPRGGQPAGPAAAGIAGLPRDLLGEAPTASSQHPPEPTAENLSGVLAAVPAAGADVGFCQDPDADRLAVIDDAGRYLGEEYTVALCVEHVLRRRRGPIVINCASSRMSEDVALRHGVPLVRSAVGEANVVDAMIEHAGPLRRRGQRRADRPARRHGPRQFRRHGPLLDAMASGS